MNSFQIVGIDPAPFAPLFDLSDAALRELGAIRSKATPGSGCPCRVSLEDASPGDELLLLPYVHQPAASPYRSSGPIYIRKGARQKTIDVGVVPPYVGKRLMSLRAYDGDDMMVDASVCEGAVIAAEIAQKFEDPRVAYIHLHNAKRGCFSCRVDRATSA